MELYADLFVLINCLCDGTVTALTALLLKRRVKKRRILLSALVGGLYALLYLLLYPAPLLLPLLSVAASLLMVLSAFGFHRPAAFLKALLHFYLVSLVAGGIVGALNELITYLLPSRSTALLLLLLIMVLLFLFCMTAVRVFIKEQQKKTAELCFFVHGGEYRITGLVDSGNLLTDPLSGRSVVLLDPAVFKKPPFCDRVILMKTAAGQKQLPAFLPDDAIVDGIARKICIALCAPPEKGFGGTDALLPPLQ